MKTNEDRNMSFVIKTQAHLLTNNHKHQIKLKFRAQIKVAI
jgi:hypothetical protein